MVLSCLTAHSVARNRNPLFESGTSKSTTFGTSVKKHLLYCNSWADLRDGGQPSPIENRTWKLKSLKNYQLFPEAMCSLEYVFLFPLLCLAAPLQTHSRCLPSHAWSSKDSHLKAPSSSSDCHH